MAGVLLVQSQLSVALQAGGHRLWQVPIEASASAAKLGAIRYQGLSFAESQKKLGSLDLLITDRPRPSARSGKAIVLPVAVTALSVAYNLPSHSGPLKLSTDALRGILDEKIRLWNDPQIQTLQTTPLKTEQRIILVQSKEIFGLLQIFANWMKRSGDRLTRPGVGLLVAEPRSAASVIKSTPNSMGLLDRAWAVQAGLRTAALQNASGEFIAPGPESLIRAADINLRRLGQDFSRVVLNPKGSGVYPHTGFVYFVVPPHVSSADRGRLKRLLGAVLSTEGDRLIQQAGFVPFSSAMKARVRERFVSF